jgi:hypothetical protein
MPVLEVTRRVEVLKEAAVEEEKVEAPVVGEASAGWRARLKEKGKGLLKRDSGRLSKRTSVLVPGTGGEGSGGKVVAGMVDQRSVMGIVVVPTEDGKAYRRIGFHECSAAVFDTLRQGYEPDFLKGILTLV